MEKSSNNSTTKRCAVVTGGNKGIGLEICRQLASEGITVILTARDEKKGIEALESLMLSDSGVSDVVFHQLDVRNPTSIASLAKFVETHYKKLDILVNNAGIIGLIIDGEAFRAYTNGGGVKISDDSADQTNTFFKQTYEVVEECVQTNYYGTKGVTEALIPLLKLSNSARIVNLSSIYGQLQFFNSQEVKSELVDVNSLTEEKIDRILMQFLKDFKEDKLEANGWPTTISAYKVSKAAINAYTRLTARRFPDFRVNCVHPGYVRTDISCFVGNYSPEEGAKAPVMVALLPNDGPSGIYFDEMCASTF